MHPVDYPRHSRAVFGFSPWSSLRALEALISVFSHVLLRPFLVVQPERFCVGHGVVRPLLQARASLGTFRAAAEAEANQAARQRSAFIEERDRSLEQVIAACARNCSTSRPAAGSSSTFHENILINRCIVLRAERNCVQNNNDGLTAVQREALLGCQHCCGLAAYCLLEATKVELLLFGTSLSLPTLLANAAAAHALLYAVCTKLRSKRSERRCCDWRQN